MRIRFASTNDLPTLVSLLESEKLVHEDLTDSRVIVLVAEIDKKIVGCIGLESHGANGIIRSAMVAQDHRKKGIARELVMHMEALAASGGIDSLYLLTERTQDFWSRMGYTLTKREDAPEVIRDSKEFTELCPSTAHCMVHHLKATAMRKFTKQDHRFTTDPSGSIHWEIAADRARLTHYEVPPHAVFPLHVHSGDQITYVTGGELIFESNGSSVTLHRDEGIVIPTDVPHSVRAGKDGATAFDAWSHPMVTREL